MKRDTFIVQNADRESAHSRMIKKKIGSFYTPQHLAKLIAEETLDAWIINQGRIRKNDISNLDKLSQSLKKQLLKNLQTIRVLDPSVGAGVFLCVAADWLNRMRKSLGDSMTPLQRRIHIVNTSLYGVDLASEAVSECKRNLIAWSYQDDIDSKALKEQDLTNIKFGNSLVGLVNQSGMMKSLTRSRLHESHHGSNIIETDDFHWFDEFKEIMQGSNPGFDVILGNPPYGNLLNDRERWHIQNTYPFNVGGGRLGTWNSAAHFIVRSRMVMKEGAQLGFLVPNSILRVHQFSKIRNYLLDEMHLWKIIDEGSPFDGVTLEMVSIFCEATKSNRFSPIEVESRRPEHEQSNRVEWDVLKSSRVFSIYHDSVYQKILNRGKRNLLIASRGRDIPKEHVREVKSNIFKTPYITSGRSVRRYQINVQHQFYTDDWFTHDERMRESFDNELLVATKNYRYPRCVIKPRGMIHGGGIVKITPLFENANIRALGLILNSRLIRYICERYLTNYSQLTTCLNTGIMNDLPVVMPINSNVFAVLFDMISQLYSETTNQQFNESRQFLEHLGNAMVYEIYFSDDQLLQDLVMGTLSKEHENKFYPIAINNHLQNEDVITAIQDIMNESTVRKIESHLGVHD